MPALVDITGQRFGKLLVTSRADNAESGGVRYNCVCDCGREQVIHSQHLRRGRAVSCERCSLPIRTGDLTGQTFGEYTIIQRAPNGNSGQARWFVKCSCGDIKEVNAFDLKSGKTTKCQKCYGKMRGGENNVRWLGGGHIRGSLAWARRRLRHLKNSHFRKYGTKEVAFDEYDLLRVFDRSKGRCEITGITQEFNGNDLCFDHCHDTRKLRGFVSDGVNKALAAFNHDPAILRKAAEYLENIG